MSERDLVWKRRIAELEKQLADALAQIETDKRLLDSLAGELTQTKHALRACQQASRT